MDTNKETALAVALNAAMKDGKHGQQEIVAPTPTVVGRTDIGVIKAAQAARQQRLAMKVNVDPELEETLTTLREDIEQLEAERAEPARILNMLEAGIKHVPTEERPAIQDQIKKMRGQVAYLEKEIAQIRADIKALSENAGPAIALAIVARSVAAATARELLSRFDGGNLTSGSIDELVRRGLESDLLTHGQGEGGFEWSGRPYHSKISGNPSAFRVIPRIVEEITRIDEEKVARRAAAARWHFSARDAVEHLGGP